MLASDLCLLGGLFAMWVGIAKFCFAIFPCPDHLAKKDAKGKLSKTYYDYYGNYVSICHAVISILVCGFVVLKEGISFGAENTFAVKVAIYNTMAYFIYDSVISEYYGYNALPMTLHHVGALVGTGAVFVSGTSGMELALALCFAEISNPFNLSREILKHYKKESSKLYFQLSISFVSLFIVARFVVFPFIIAAMYPSATNLVLKITLGFVWFISWHWLFIIFNFALKEIKKAIDKSGAKGGKASAMNDLYATLSGLRKNKTFLFSYYLVAGWLSLGTLYFAHNKA